MKVLVINPGATSTKVAVFEEEQELLKKMSIVHPPRLPAQELGPMSSFSATISPPMWGGWPPSCGFPARRRCRRWRRAPCGCSTVRHRRKHIKYVPV